MLRCISSAKCLALILLKIINTSNDVGQDLPPPWLILTLPHHTLPLHGRHHAQTTSPQLEYRGGPRPGDGGARGMRNSVWGDVPRLVFFPSPQRFIYRGYNRQNQVLTSNFLVFPSSESHCLCSPKPQQLQSLGRGCSGVETAQWWGLEGLHSSCFFFREKERRKKNKKSLLTDLCEDRFPVAHYQGSRRTRWHTEQTLAGSLPQGSKARRPRALRPSEPPVPAGEGVGPREPPLREAIPGN